MDLITYIGKDAHFGNLSFLGGHVEPDPICASAEPMCTEPPEIEDWYTVPDGEMCIDYCSDTRKATDQHWSSAANALEVEVALVKAFAKIETNINGFWPSGKPKIRIMPNQFEKYYYVGPARSKEVKESMTAVVKQAYSDTTQEGKKKVAKSEEVKDEQNWLVFSILYEWDPFAIIAATSFGMMQIHGFEFFDKEQWEFLSKKQKELTRNGKKWTSENYGEFKNEIIGKLTKFKDDMMCNEEQHLIYFVEVCKKKGIHKHMKDFHWVKMAHYYNGPCYMMNKKDLGGYDLALAKYYLELGGAQKQKAQDHIDNPSVLRSTVKTPSYCK